MGLEQIYLLVSFFCIAIGGWAIGKYAGSQVLGGGIAVTGVGLVLGMSNAAIIVIQHLH